MRILPGSDVPRKNPRPADPYYAAEYPREARFQRDVEGWFRQMGWMVYHTWGSMNSAGGFPDLVAVHPSGVMLFAELKTETGVVSEKQIAWLTALANAHEHVYCWRPSDTDEILALIQDVHSHV